MKIQTEAIYVKEADLGSVPLKEPMHRHVQEPLPRETVDRLGSTLLIGRYASGAELYWETNAYGRRVWMMGGIHRILIAVRTEIEAGHDLASKTIAGMAQVSRSYVTRSLRWLDRFGFITILGSWRGRWGRVVAKLKSIVPPPSIGSRSTGGTIKPVRAPLAPEPTFDDAFYAAWDANEAKRLQL